MNKYEREQVEAIIFAAWQAEDGIHKDIPWQGCSVAGQLVDFRGDIPPPSNFKVESVSRRAELLKRFCLSDFQMYSFYLIRCLPNKPIQILLAPRRLETMIRKRPNGETVAAWLELTHADYRDKKRRYRGQLLKLDQLFRSHVYNKICA